MDSQGTRGEAELAASVEAAGEGEVSGGVGFCVQERKIQPYFL